MFSPQLPRISESALQLLLSMLTLCPPTTKVLGWNRDKHQHLTSVLQISPRLEEMCTVICKSGFPLRRELRTRCHFFRTKPLPVQGWVGQEWVKTPQNLTVILKIAFSWLHILLVVMHLWLFSKLQQSWLKHLLLFFDVSVEEWDFGTSSSAMLLKCGLSSLSW